MNGSLHPAVVNPHRGGPDSRGSGIGEGGPALPNVVLFPGPLYRTCHGSIRRIRSTKLRGFVETVCGTVANASAKFFRTGQAAVCVVASLYYESASSGESMGTARFLEMRGHSNRFGKSHCFSGFQVASNMVDPLLPPGYRCPLGAHLKTGQRSGAQIMKLLCRTGARPVFSLLLTRPARPRPARGRRMLLVFPS